MGIFDKMLGSRDKSFKAPTPPPVEPTPVQTPIIKVVKPVPLIEVAPPVVIEKLITPADELREALAPLGIDKAKSIIDGMIIGGARAIISRDSSGKTPSELISGILEGQDLFRRHLDLGNVYKGCGFRGEDSMDFPRSQLATVLKGLGVLPQSAPDDGNFPRGHEHHTLIEFLRANSGVTEETVILGRMSSFPVNVPPVEVISLTIPTKVAGVDVTVSIPKDHQDSAWGGSPDGYTMVSCVGLELKREFYEKALGVAKPESPTKQ